MSILETLISKDYTIVNKGSKWATTTEHDSLIIDREKEIFFWNSRNVAGNALTWLIEIKGLSIPDAKKVLFNVKDYSETVVYTIKGQEEDIVVYPKLVEIFWENGLNNREYWYKRLLTDDTINRFQLGYHDGMYLIPFFMDGTFRNFQCRRDDPKIIRPWYRGVGPLLFNSDILKLVDKVLIAEGTVDVILLNQLGFPAVGHNAGASWQDKLWHDKFSRLKEIIYVADNDKVGILAGRLVAKSLSTARVRIATFNGYPEKYDTVDFFKNKGSIEEFRNILNKARYLEEFGGNYEPKLSY